MGCGLTPYGLIAGLGLAGVMLALRGVGGTAGGVDVEGVDLGRFFTLAELTRTNTGRANVPTAVHVDRLRYLVASVLDPWRVLVGPLQVTSGYRSPAVNAAVGGVKGSGHTKGTAADVKPSRMSSPAAFVALKQAATLGRWPVRQAILYSPTRGGHIHVEVGDEAAPGGQWLYAPNTGGYEPWRG